jgi:hypothetical protein
MRILLAIDGTTYSDTAVDEVARRPWPANSEVKIISAVEPPVISAVEPWTVAPTYFDEIEKIAHDKALAAVESGLSKLRNEGGTRRSS